jgi:hypothetical protein
VAGDGAIDGVIGIAQAVQDVAIDGRHTAWDESATTAPHEAKFDSAPSASPTPAFVTTACTNHAPAAAANAEGQSEAVAPNAEAEIDVAVAATTIAASTTATAAPRFVPAPAPTNHAAVEDVVDPVQLERQRIQFFYDRTADSTM